MVQPKSNSRPPAFRAFALRQSESKRRSDEGLTLKTSAFLTFNGGNSNFINSFDKAKHLKALAIDRMRKWTFPMNQGKTGSYALETFSTRVFYWKPQTAD